jgi:transketolase
MKRFPNNFFNVGVAEQNMIGIAAGLSLTGKKVFVYSIAPFSTSRCFEQIKVNVAYHNLDVVIVGVGGGFSYSKSGSTHHSFEDIGIIRTLPNIKILCPGDPFEVRASMSYILEQKGPVYLRLGKSNDPNIHSKSLKISSLVPIFEGEGGAILTTGNMLGLGVQIREDLKEKYNICFSLYSCPLIKPFDEENIRQIASKNKFLFSIEEHVREGGLTSTVSEILINMDKKNFIFKGFYIKKGFIKEVGSQDYLRSISGLSKDTIIKEIMDKIKENVR